MVTTTRRALLAAVVVFNLVMVPLVLRADAAPQTCDDTRPGVAAACVADRGAEAELLLLFVGNLVLAGALVLVTARRRRSR